MKKKIMSLILISSFSMCVFGCSKTDPESSELLTSQVDETNISVSDETIQTTIKSNDWTMPTVPLSDPITDVSEMFSEASENAFVPFQDPERSFCWNQEGFAGPVLYQSTGSCDIYAGVTVLDVNYQIENGELPYIDPLDVLDRIYIADPDDPNSPEGLYIKIGNFNDYGAHEAAGTVFALSTEPYDGYLLKDYNVRYRNKAIGEQSFSIDEVKELVKENGPIEVDFTWDYDKSANGIYTQSTSLPRDHWVALVGWDDDFPADYFQSVPSSNGAWLIQNSRSTSWGNNGYAWVSYDYGIDSIITGNLTNDYSYGVATGKIPAIDVRTKDADETIAASIFNNPGELKALGIIASPRSNDTPVELTIEIYDGQFGELLTTLTYESDITGYHVIELDEPLNVTEFTVVEKAKNGFITTEANSFYMEAQDFRMSESGYAVGKLGSVVHTDPGVSFFYIDGEWIDVTSEQLLSELIYGDIAPGVEITCIGEPTIVALFG